MMRTRTGSSVSSRLPLSLWSPLPIRLSRYRRGERGRRRGWWGETDNGECNWIALLCQGFSHIACAVKGRCQAVAPGC
ncbi:hypothetical protein Q5P01_020665 [Channa striata]|uniref:Uncharacterized protein n=1 Tax=Channa striata TaxID=64152 RepID=A0AA88SBM2_CHASR|nr:hypothetical protein Q5P01_020665 [Channa striata]